MAYPQPPDGTQPPSGPQPPFGPAWPSAPQTDGTQAPYGYQPAYVQPPPYGQQPAPLGQPSPYGQPPPYQPQPYGVDPFFAPPRKPFWTSGKVTGLVVGVVLAVFFCGVCVVLPIIGVLSDRSPDTRFDPGDFVSHQPLEEPPPTLSIGQCVSMIEGATSHVSSAVVPCSEEHLGEVFEIIPISGDVYPGEDALKGKTKNCSARLSAYANMSKTKKMSVFALYPSSERWRAGDRMVYCIVGSETVSTTGSVSRSY
jgi:Septum formation